MELCGQAAQDLLTISGSLGGHVQDYSSCQEALSHAMTTVQQNKNLWNSFEFSRHVLSDVAALLTKSWLPFILHALSDVSLLLERGRKAAKKNKEVSSQVSKRLWLANKKCIFYLSWCVECADLLVQLQIAVQLEINNSQAEEAAQKKTANISSNPEGTHVVLDT
jgi:hypothetical protein